MILSPLLFLQTNPVTPANDWRRRRSGIESLSYEKHLFQLTIFRLLAPIVRPVQRGYVVPAVALCLPFRSAVPLPIARRGQGDEPIAATNWPFSRT
jgi:hypothetical protein